MLVECRVKVEDLRLVRGQHIRIGKLRGRLAKCLRSIKASVRDLVASVSAAVGMFTL